jgi:hypothetical protein
MVGCIFTVKLGFGRFDQKIKICNICMIIALLDDELVPDYLNCSSIIGIYCFSMDTSKILTVRFHFDGAFATVGQGWTTLGTMKRFMRYTEISCLCRRLRMRIISL